jgi:ATP-dependent Lon protease
MTKIETNANTTSGSNSIMTRSKSSTTKDCKDAKSPKSKRSSKLKQKQEKVNEPDSSSDDESHTSSEYEEEFDEFDEDEAGELDRKEFNKFLMKLFPSKHLKRKIKKMEEEDDESDEEEQENEIIEETRNKKSKKNQKIQKKEFEQMLKKRNKSNSDFIVLQFDLDKSNDEEYDEDDSEYDEDSEYEYDSDEETLTTSDDESDSDDDDSDSESESEEDEEERPKSRKNKETKELQSTEECKEEKQMIMNFMDSLESSELPNSELSKNIRENARKMLHDEMEAIDKKLNKKNKKVQKKNVDKFRKLLRGKLTTTDVGFFGNLKLEEQTKIMSELEEVNKSIVVEKPYRITLLESEIPAHFKACAMKKVNMLRQMEPGAGEYYKVKNWIDTFMKIPFNKYSNLELTMEDGVDKCHEFMESAKNSLDQVVYGLEDAKMQIMQLIGQMITNPQALGTAIAIQGPMGTGKTTLVKEGISKILGREFAFIALGGATDSSFLEGHSYTYEGSMWGKIVDILIKCKTMNPVIYFDELDKVSDTPRGEEIIGILTHLTDTSQNNEFHDKFFSEIEFDLSKCLFIFSYNDESKVNPILKDRMYRIHTKGYNVKDKQVICNKHVLPKIIEQVKFNDGDIIIEEDVIAHIVENHTAGEQGIRNLKRCLEIIHTKLNLYRLMKPDTKLFQDELTLDVQFPFKVTKEVVEKLLKTAKNDNMSFKQMFI